MKCYNSRTNVYLLTPHEFAHVPDGTILTHYADLCDDVVKGIDFKDKEWYLTDMYSNTFYLPYGIKDPWNHPLKDLFLIFKIIE
jgi:hypothetical protein